MRVITLNANGIRSAAAKGAFAWLRDQSADVVCLQETKAHEPQLVGHDIELPGYHRFFCDAERPGYSGTALYCKRKPTEVIRLLKGRLYGVHLKDFKEMQDQTTGVILGRGHLDVPAVFAALEQAGFPENGALSLEYEEHPENPLDEIRECIQVAQDAMAKA